SGFLLTALLNDRQLGSRARMSSPELAKISAEKLLQELKALLPGSKEDEGEPAASSAEAGARQPSGSSATPSLDQFTLTLPERAPRGEIDPVTGRDAETRQMIDLLTRRRQNNPILTGEAGVGKTAVVEGLALRIVAGDVPTPLRNVDVRTLDLGLLQAG